MAIPVPGRLAESVRRSVVQVRAGRRGSGSGVVVAPGKILTNAHVLDSSVETVEVDTWEGASLAANAIRLNRSRDLALLSAPGLQASDLTLGDSRNVRPGLPVFAVGNPMGFVGALSSGVIHSVSLRRWLCADIRLMPGNSGGPLLTFTGQMIGINTMVMSNGLALAVPGRAVQKFLRHDDARSLGVLIRGVEFQGRFGILITGLVPDSAAARASLQPGDVLSGANGVPFTHADDLGDAIDDAPDGLLRLEFYRGDNPAARSVTADVVRQSVRTAA